MGYVAVVTEDLFLSTKVQDILRRVGMAAHRTAPGLLGAEKPLPDALVLDLSLPAEVRSAVLAWVNRRLPVIAFGPHVDAEALFWARQAGCAQVLTKGQMDQRLAQAVLRSLPADAAP